MGGRAALGSLHVSAPSEAGEGKSVRAFVRPHDVELSATQGAGPAIASAEIRRMSRVGFMIKLELVLSDGQPLSVELTKDRVAELGLAERDRVFVNLREARIFVQEAPDYSI